MLVLIIFSFFFNLLFSAAEASSFKGKAIVCEQEDEEKDNLTTVGGTGNYTIHCPVKWLT